MGHTLTHSAHCPQFVSAMGLSWKVETIRLKPLCVNPMAPMPNFSWHTQTHLPHRTHLLGSYIKRELLSSMGRFLSSFLNRFVFSFIPRCLAIFWSSHERFFRQWGQSTGWLASISSAAVRASLKAFLPRVLTTMPSLTGSVQAMTGSFSPSTSTKHRRHEAEGCIFSWMAQRLGM